MNKHFNDMNVNIVIAGHLRIGELISMLIDGGHFCCCFFVVWDFHTFKTFISSLGLNWFASANISAMRNCHMILEFFLTVIRRIVVLEKKVIFLSQFGNKDICWNLEGRLNMENYKISILYSSS